MAAPRLYYRPCSLHTEQMKPSDLLMSGSKKQQTHEAVNTMTTMQQYSAGEICISDCLLLLPSTFLLEA